MGLFPLKAVEADVEWRINRTEDEKLLLTCVTGAETVSIAFPEYMVIEMAHRIVEATNRLEADTKTAQMFRRSVPEWPRDIFAEEGR